MRVVFPFHLLRHCIRNQEELGTYFVPHTHQPTPALAEGQPRGAPREARETRTAGRGPVLALVLKLATLGTEGEHQGGVQGIGEGGL